MAWTAVPTGSDNVRHALCRVFERDPVETTANWVSRKVTPPDAMRRFGRVVGRVAELSAFADRSVQLKRRRVLLRGSRAAR